MVTNMKKELATLKSVLSAKSPFVKQDDEPKQNNGNHMTSSRSYSSVVSGTVLPQLSSKTTHAKGSKSSPLESAEAPGSTT